jgi:hypothetical protein
MACLALPRQFISKVRYCSTDMSQDVSDHRESPRDVPLMDPEFQTQGCCNSAGGGDLHHLRSSCHTCTCCLTPQGDVLPSGFCLPVWHIPSTGYVLPTTLQLRLSGSMFCQLAVRILPAGPELMLYIYIFCQPAVRVLPTAGHATHIQALTTNQQFRYIKHVL